MKQCTREEIWRNELGGTEAIRRHFVDGSTSDYGATHLFHQRRPDEVVTHPVVIVCDPNAARLIKEAWESDSDDVELEL